jgi:hypothetical protein
MNRIPIILILVLTLITGCRKSNNNYIWEKSFGKGRALFIKATPDSGLISCGQLEGKPYMIKLDKNKNKTSDFTYIDNGLYSSAWSDRFHFLAVGSSNGKMLISCIDNEGSHKWDTALIASFKIDFSLVCYLGNGNLLGIASAAPDSANTIVTGLYCVWFDTTGTITEKKEIKEASFFSANKAVTDNSGNIYIAASRKSTGTEVRSTVIKYNSTFQKIWETELYNNPSFAASTFGISLDNAGNVFVSGTTKIANSKETVVNSTASSLTSSGAIRWKQYLEIDNSGTSVLINDMGQVFILNQNCYIISVLKPTDGTEDGLIRTFDACDSKSTNSLAKDFTFNYDDNILIAGQHNGSFYLIMKSALYAQLTQ